MKQLAHIILLLLLFSCEKNNNDSIPANIKINHINLDEDSTQNITDAWVYINDQLQGVYELPAEFPLLDVGINKLRIKAGIKDNGIASSRTPYAFYSSYIQEEAEFIADEEKEISPIINYIEGVTMLTEDNNITLNKTNYSDTIIHKEAYYNVGYLDGSLVTFEIASNELTDLPQGGAPVYLELDYKCNTEFLVGVYLNYTPTIVKKEVLWINPKEEWNKIYVNLTSIISEGVNCPSFSVFISMRRNTNININTLYFKNFRIVY